MSVTDKIFFGGFIPFALVAGLCIGYGVANARAAIIIERVTAERDALAVERDLAVAAAADYRGQLGRLGELAGQLGDGLADAVARAAKATDYRRGAQIYIDSIRATVRGLELLASHRAVENCEVVPDQ